MTELTLKDKLAKMLADKQAKDNPSVLGVSKPTKPTKPKETTSATTTFKGKVINSLPKDTNLTKPLTPHSLTPNSDKINLEEINLDKPILDKPTKETKSKQQAKLNDSMSLKDKLAQLGAKTKDKRSSFDDPNKPKFSKHPIPKASEETKVNKGDNLNKITELHNKMAELSNKAENKVIHVTANIDVDQAGELDVNFKAEHKQVTLSDLNEEQFEAATALKNGESIVLVGSAGSGKTTTQQVGLSELVNSGLPSLTKGTKFFHEGNPAVLIVSFTNVAVNNMKKNAPSYFRNVISTIHRAIEFQPTKVIDEVHEYDDEGNITDTVEVPHIRFMPARTADNPLPDFRLCIVEEAGSVSTDLFTMLREALPADIAFIFLGDLNQLPPVYGLSVLGFAMTKFRVIELTKVYRTANDSPIKLLAQQVIAGKPIRESELRKLANIKLPHTSLDMRPLPGHKGVRDLVVKPLDGLRLNKAMAKYFNKQIDDGLFKDDGSCIALLPMKKDDPTKWLNVAEVNRNIADKLTKDRGDLTHEIVAGFKRSFWAEGDLVFQNKLYWKISSIEINPKYTDMQGHNFKQASTTLDRWGRDPVIKEDYGLDETNDAVLAANKLLEIDDNDMEELRKAASHIVTLTPANNTEMDLDLPSVILSSSGEINEMALGYAQTIHKSQGSEWERMWLLLPDQATFMINREMLYTGITRARDHLTIFYSDGISDHNKGKGTFDIGVRRQAIQGTKLEDKIAWFLNKAEDNKYSSFIEDMWPSSIYPTTSQYFDLLSNKTNKDS